VTLKRDLRYIMYISIDKTFTVYIAELQSLIMMINIVSIVKIMKSEL